MAGLSDDTAARWITTDPATYTSNALPVFRRTIPIEKPVTRATAQLCGLGHHELQINGTKAGNDLLEPAWSNYAKTCLYVTHDVTSLLRDGENVIDVWLGNGMFNVTGGRYVKFKGTFGRPMMIFLMQVEYADGTSQAIVSDRSWRVAPGSITFSCIYGGEDYDARLAAPIPSPGTSGEGGSRWQSVALTECAAWRLVEQKSPPIRVMRTFIPVKVSEDVYDFRQNFSGWVKIAVRGNPGDTITLTTAELLDENGLPDQSRIGKPVSFRYTCKGGGVETWRPRFSYHGFRYVKVEGIEPIELEGQFIHSSARAVGQFQCSNPLLNRIHELILNSIRSNMQHVLTDCPHREKLGWLEQTHLVGPAILYNFDAASLYEKLSDDVRDAQHVDGCVPVIAPQYTLFPRPWDVFNDSPEWGSAAVINPWLVYQFTGNKRIIDENYDSMKRYIAYLASRANDNVIAYGLGDWYDIGPGEPGFSKLTTLGVTATATYFQDLAIMRDVASLLNRHDDARAFAGQAETVRRAFNARFFTASTSQYDTGSQCANAMPLALDIVEPQHRAAVLENLIGDIRARGNAITAGDVGFRYVIDALARAGRSDVLYDMFTRTDPPSYGCQVNSGATSLTEAWDANPRKSQNHFMLGHAEIWFYRDLAGIQVDLSREHPDRIVIRPSIVGDLHWAKASYDSVLGRIEARWERTGQQIRANVTVPSRATVYLIDGSKREVGPGTHDISCHKQQGE
jgi:hypothetical protein